MIFLGVRWQRPCQGELWMLSMPLIANYVWLRWPIMSIIIELLQPNKTKSSA